MTEVVFVVCSPKLLEGPSPLRKPDDLRHHTMLHDDLPEDWETWLEAAGVGGIRARRDLAFNHSEMVLQAAIDGLGVPLWRSVLLAADLTAGRRVQPLPPELPTSPASPTPHPAGPQPH